MIKKIAVITFAWALPAFAAGPVSVAMKNMKGEAIGTATLSEVAKGVKIVLDLHSLPPGEHGFHVHEKSVCIAPKFDSAGGHFNPSKHEHGFNSKDGYHVGDMPNIVVAADGKLKTEIVNTTVTLDSGPAGLLGAGGTAFIIHEKADDYKSQPAGNAGARLACGEIKP